MDPIDRVLTVGRIILAAVKGAQNAILANTAEYDDDSGNPAGGLGEQTMYGTAGMYCRPMPPDADGVCEAVLMKQTDGAPVLASRDLRCNARVNPAEGELGLAHYGGGYVSLAWDADKRGTQLVISSPRLDSQLKTTQSAHALIFDPSSGNSSVQLLHALGGGLVMNVAGDVYFSNAGDSGAAARLTLYSDGKATLNADQGLKIPAATIIGDVTQAREVALVAEVQAAVQTLLASITTLSSQLQMLGGGGDPGGIAALGANLAQIASTGTAKTLKASPI